MFLHTKSCGFHTKSREKTSHQGILRHEWHTNNHAQWETSAQTWRKLHTVCTCQLHASSSMHQVCLYLKYLCQVIDIQSSCPRMISIFLPRIQQLTHWIFKIIMGQLHNFLNWKHYGKIKIVSIKHPGSRENSLIISNISTWMSQEVSKRLVSRLQLQYSPFTTHLLTSRYILVLVPFSISTYIINILTIQYVYFSWTIVKVSLPVAYDPILVLDIIEYYDFQSIIYTSKLATSSLKPWAICEIMYIFKKKHKALSMMCFYFKQWNPCHFESKKVPGSHPPTSRLIIVPKFGWLKFPNKKPSENSRLAKNTLNFFRFNGCFYGRLQGILYIDLYIYIYFVYPIGSMGLVYSPTPTIKPGMILFSSFLTRPWPIPLQLSLPSSLFKGIPVAFLNAAPSEDRWVDILWRSIGNRFISP